LLRRGIEEARKRTKEERKAEGKVKNNDVLVRMTETLDSLSTLLKSGKALSGYGELKTLLGLFSQLTELSIALKIDEMKKVKEAQEEDNVKLIDRVCEANLEKPRELIRAIG